MSTQCLLERPAVLARLRARRAILRPPPRMNLSDWADAFRVVPRKTSATPGRWRSNLQPVGIGIVNAVSHPEVTTVTGMLGTQLTKSEVLLNVFGYFAALDPGPILLVQPTQASAESFSKER